MHDTRPKRYFALRTRLPVEQRRLFVLMSGTLIALLLTTAALRANVAPRSDGQVFFRPNQPVSNDDLAQANVPPPTVPPLPAVESGAPIDPAAVLPGIKLDPTLINDIRFTSEPNLTVPAIQTLLDAQPGPLKNAVIPVGDRNQSAAEVIVGQAYLYSLNPKLILALLEFQQGLLSNPTPTPDQLDWAMKFDGENEKWRGLHGQIRWAARELRRGVRDYPYVTELQFKDENVKTAIPTGLNAGSYAIVRTLAATMTPADLDRILKDGSFVATYTKLFEDPRQPLGALPAPSEPFLRRPLAKPIYITSFFDHEYPFLAQNGTLVAWTGRRETTVSYDGHDGWDYGAKPPELVTAAANGTVVWAGNSDDGCGIPARGVVIDHGNGYRTLYWHLNEISVTLGQQLNAGDQVGIVGATGCAIGPHLHFQTQYLGRNTDPYGWCSTEPDPWASYAVGTSSRWLWKDRPNPCDLGQNALVVTHRSPTFSKTGDGWQTAPLGVSGESLWVLSHTPPVTTTDVLTDTLNELAGVTTPEPTADPGKPPQPPASATWRITLPQAGNYRVLAYIPYYYNGHEEAYNVKYTVHHAGGSNIIAVNQYVFTNEWVDLGTYTFDPAGDPRVEISNETDQVDASVWVGAMLWQPVP